MPGVIMVTMNDDEFAAWEKFSANRVAVLAKEAQELSDNELEERLMDILRPSLNSLLARRDLNLNLVPILRNASKVLDINQRKREKDTTYIGRLIKAAEDAVKILAVKPRPGLRKAMGVKYAVMAGLAPQMVESYKLQIASCERYEGDLSMISMFLDDAANHMELGCHLYQGNIHQAQRASEMDTSSREDIPEAVWNFVCESYHTN